MMPHLISLSLLLVAVVLLQTTNTCCHAASFFGWRRGGDVFSQKTILISTTPGSGEEGDGADEQTHRQQRQRDCYDCYHAKNIINNNNNNNNAAVDYRSRRRSRQQQKRRTHSFDDYVQSSGRGGSSSSNPEYELYLQSGGDEVSGRVVPMSSPSSEMAAELASRRKMNGGAVPKREQDGDILQWRQYEEERIQREYQQWLDQLREEQQQ
mmetsp:Transcript_10537/g.25136  ORF Transcript_10537/g.25136 Transcript_10537/m.25136 type:complete len:210 (+) Transcript_10537:179-808(+)